MPALDRVLTLLDNLVQQIDAAAVAEKADYEAFVQWVDEEEVATTAEISRLEVRLPEVGAVVAQLEAQHASSAAHVASLEHELAQEKGALQTAVEKRAAERQTFLAEQQDFTNSVAACAKAVTLLGDTYTPAEEVVKPQWLSLIRTATAKLSALSLPATAKLSALSFPSGSTLHNVYQEQTGEGQNIITLVKDLAQTFEQDKLEAAEQEASVQQAFDELAGQKQAVISSFEAEYATQHAGLTATSQQLSEQQGALQQTQQQLDQARAYLASLAEQRTGTGTAYEARQKDQAAEREAVQAAAGVVQGAMPALLQLKLLQLPHCRRCDRAAAMLHRKAFKLRSGLLATAAAAAGVGASLQPLVEDLMALIRRLDEQQASEAKHKEWCEQEMTATAAKRSHHEGLVGSIAASISDTEAVVEEKKAAVEGNADDLTQADTSFATGTARREQAHADFEAEQQGYADAIAALKEAVGLLADFYGEKPGLMQMPKGALSLSSVYARMRPARSSRKRAAMVQMPSLSAEYARKGGDAVVESLTKTLEEFEASASDAAATEEQEVAAYAHLAEEHSDRRAQLAGTGIQLSTEMQAAEAKLAADGESRAASEAEIHAADAYLNQVGQSCGSLIDNFADRSELRQAEKQAITDAIAVLAGSD